MHVFRLPAPFVVPVLLSACFIIACSDASTGASPAESPDAGAPESGSSSPNGGGAEAGPGSGADPERSVSGTFRTHTLPAELTVWDLAVKDDTVLVTGPGTNGKPLVLAGKGPLSETPLPAGTTSTSGFSKTDDGDLVLRTNGSTALYYASDATWKPFALPDEAYSARSLVGASRTHFYVSTEMAVFKKDGSQSSMLGDLPRAGILYATGPSDYWYTAGYGSSLYHHEANQTWKELKQYQGTGMSISGERGIAFGLTTSDKLVSDVWTFRDGSWTRLPAPAGGYGCVLSGLWSSGSKNTWLVGSGGCIFHWNGIAFSRVASPTKDALGFIQGSDPEHVWAATSETHTLLELVPE